MMNPVQYLNAKRKVVKRYIHIISHLTDLEKKNHMMKCRMTLKKMCRIIINKISNYSKIKII